MCVYVCVCSFVRVRVRSFVRVCVCVLQHVNSVASLICFAYTLTLSFSLPFLSFSGLVCPVVREQTFLVTALSVFLHCNTVNSCFSFSLTFI